MIRIVYKIISIILCITLLSVSMPQEAFALRPLSTRISKEGQLIQEFEEGLKDKLTEFFTATEPENEKLKEEIIELLLNNLNGVNGGIGIVHMAIPRAREWQDAALSHEDIANMLKSISGVDCEWDSLLDFTHMVLLKKNSIYGDLFIYSHKGNEADFYHTSTSLLLDSILINGILPLDVVERRGLNFKIARKSFGQGKDSDVVALSFDFDDCLSFQVASSNRFIGYQIVFGVSENGTKRTFVRDRNSLSDRSEPSERQVREVNIKDITHIYVPTIEVEEVRRKLQKQKIDWIQVVSMQPGKDEPASRLSLLNSGKKIQKLLIVDDTKQVIDNLKDALNQLELYIHTEDDALDALEKIEEQMRDKDIDSLFDLIVTDNDMALMQGQQFIGKLRELGYRGPIVLMTLRPYALEENGFIERRNHPTDNSEANYWHFELTLKGIREFGPNTIILHKIESTYKVFPDRVRRLVTLLNEGKTVTKNDLDLEGTNYTNTIFALETIDKLLKEKFDLATIKEIISACQKNQQIAEKIVQKLTEYGESRENSYEVRQRAANLMERLTRAGVRAARELEAIVGFVENIQGLDSFELEGRNYLLPSWPMSILKNTIVNNMDLLKADLIQDLILGIEATITDLKQIDQNQVSEAIGRKIRSACSQFDGSFIEYVGLLKENHQKNRFHQEAIICAAIKSAA